MFSTILTAFIAVSLGWFAEDYTQTTAQLLQQISVQLANDTSRTIVAEPPPFEVAPIDLAINILWFLSLVLCLAASLFGMIVKGWLREYSMWETEPAQDAIWLRQIRYNAFQKWKVPLIVALLPGLLELALILFMAGIVAMLWTLNSLLALIVTFVTASFAVIVFVMVVIPAFFPHCPYRSPAGWTCVLLWNTLASMFYRLLWFTGQCSRPFLRDRLNEYRELEDWKKRDFHLDILSHRDQQISSCFELHTSKLLHLVDALAWTFERCQNESVLQDLHFVAGKEMSPDMLLRLPLYTACRKFGINSEALFTDIHAQYSRGDQHNPGMYILSPLHRPDILDPSLIPRGVIFLEILGLILLDQVQDFVRSLVAPEHTPAKPWDLTSLVDALCFLCRVARLSPSSRVKTAYSDFLVQLYQATITQDEKEPKENSVRQFRTLVLELLMKLGSIRLSGSQVSGIYAVSPACLPHNLTPCILVDTEHAHMTFRDYARLAVSVFRGNDGYSDPESRHLFVTLSNAAIQNCSSWYTSLYNQEDLQSIMQCLEAAARVSLDSRIPNCGYYTHLPWISSLSSAAESNPGFHAYIPLSLLRTLEESISVGLIAGNLKTQRQLEELLVRCACRETVVIAPTPEASLEGEEPKQGPHAQANGQIALDDDARSLLPLAIPSCGEHQEDGRYDSSCQTPLLGTPSSATLANNTPSISPRRSTASLDRAL